MLFFVMAALTCTTWPAANARGEEIFYVAPDGNDAWSGRIPSVNQDKSDGPFASIQRARNAIREMKAAGRFTAPVTVQIRGGKYYLTEPIVFAPEDSGDAQRPISYVAAPGERPEMSGGKRITGFKPSQGQVQTVVLPEVKEGQWNFRSLFADGQRQIRARYPNLDPSDPCRKGFLYTRCGPFGVAIGAAHNAGDWLEYEFDAPADGEYALWVLYAHGMKALGRADMAGQTSVRIDDGGAVPLRNLPDSGGWQVHRWSQAASLNLKAGRRTLRWTNDKGGGINFDVFALSDDPDWKPTDWRLPKVAPEKHLVLIQAEECAKKHGKQIVLCQGYGIGMTKTMFVYGTGEVKPSWTRTGDAEVHIWPSSQQSCRSFNEIVKLEKVDEATGMATVSGKEAAVPFCSGDRFFVENVPEELDSPGEWYLDTKTGMLSYWPPKPLTAASEVVAPRLSRMVEFAGDPVGKRAVRYIRLSGLTIEETDYTPDDGFVAYGKSIDGVVTLRGAENCRIEDCVFRNIGKSAIYCDDGRDNAIVGNEICYVAEGGIYFKNSSGGNIISDNHIHHCGQVYKHVAGIRLMENVNDTLVSHNLIHDMTRWGIGLGIGQRNVVEYNHVHHVNTETYDTGGIEVTQQDRQFRSGSIFRYNLVHDTGGFSSQMGKDMWCSWGIYLDSFAGGYTVHHNVVYRTSHGGIMLQGGKDNAVRNNIFVDSKYCQVYSNNHDNNSTGLVFERNVVSYSDPEAVLLRVRTPRPEVIRSDYNLFHFSGGREIRIGYAGNETLNDWLKKGFDANSLVADPLFVDPKSDNYALRPESPAFKLGFEAIDLSQVGPRKPEDRPGNLQRER